MPGDLAAVDRRHRRLQQLKVTSEIDRASAALRSVWEQGRQPEVIRLRRSLISSPGEASSPVMRLLNPRGIALSFYLIAVFEAHCRLAPGQPWFGNRQRQGRQGQASFGWSNFVAVDAAYSSETGTYLRETKHGRDAETSRLRQLQGALRTLEDIGGESEALVQVPRKANRRTRDYGGFRLMRESGRGPLHAPDHYSVPAASEGTIVIPRAFFLRGWVHVLSPAETTTWLALQQLSQSYPMAHMEKGVYLYAKRREEEFGLLRDSYEDSCNTLRSLGLIRYAVHPSGFAQPGGPRFTVPGGSPATPIAIDFSQSDETPPARRYAAYRYQVVDEALEENALEKTMKELVHRRRALQERQKNW